ncbi:hypothetical protein HJC99_02165 [Candidatus Saccharibacteria bacterium]|nr:hypothetical protein [Candidatus Saccharibacteria bacterium]
MVVTTAITIKCHGTLRNSNPHIDPADQLAAFQIAQRVIADLGELGRYVSTFVVGAHYRGLDFPVELTYEVGFTIAAFYISPDGIEVIGTINNPDIEFWRNWDIAVTAAAIAGKIVTEIQRKQAHFTLDAKRLQAILDASDPATVVPAPSSN